MTKLRDRAEIFKTRAQRKQEWRETVLQIARARGDRRGALDILREATQLAATISRCFRESKQDHETAEVISQNTYSLFNMFGREILLIDEGTVILQSGGRRHIDPVFKTW